MRLLVMENSGLDVVDMTAVRENCKPLVASFQEHDLHRTEPPRGC